MRLWAYCDSITFCELVPRIGEVVDLFLGLSTSYVHSMRKGSRPKSWPFDISVLGEKALVQVPELGRTMTALTGQLSKEGEERSSWVLESNVSVRLLARDDPSRRLLDKLTRDAAMVSCQVFGSLSIRCRELNSTRMFYNEARIFRFQSLCLQADDPRFGQWFDVRRYADLGSDPDVIGAPVCLAEVDLEADALCVVRAAETRHPS